MNIAGVHKFPLFVLARAGTIGSPRRARAGGPRPGAAEPTAAGGKAEIVALEGGWVEDSPPEPDLPPVRAPGRPPCAGSSRPAGIPYVALDHGVDAADHGRWLALRP
jgi:hypothetical protein